MSRVNKRAITHTRSSLPSMIKNIARGTKKMNRMTLNSFNSEKL